MKIHLVEWIKTSHFFLLNNSYNNYKRVQATKNSVSFIIHL